MLALAHESSLFNSHVPHPRRGWATLTSFALQAAGVALVLIVPLLQPTLLPSMDLTPHVVPVFLPHIETADVQHGASSSNVTPNVNAVVAPWQVPKSVNTTADSKPASDAEPACIGCIPGPGKQGVLPTGMYIALAGPAPLPVPVAKPKRVSVMMEGYVIHRVQPDYPAMAKRIRVQGRVEIAAVISKEGTIESLQVLSGHPMLASAAIDAVKQWRYRPYILNGDPIEVNTQISVTFSLDN